MTSFVFVSAGTACVITAVLLAYSICKVSSKISRMEEEDEWKKKQGEREEG